LATFSSKGPIDEVMNRCDPLQSAGPLFAGKASYGYQNESLTDVVRAERENDVRCPELEGSAGIHGVPSDATAGAADEVTASALNRDQAKDRILDSALDAAFINACPETLRRDLREVLSVMIDEDPYLCSLAAAIAPFSPK
jgi:hypothetical protein